MAGVVSLYADENYQPPPPKVNTYVKLYPFDEGHVEEFEAFPGNI